MAEEGNAGYQAGIAKRSEAQKVAWALMGAPMRKKDLRLNALAGIAEGRKLRDRLTTLLTRRGVDPDEGIVVCVFAKPDLSALADPVPEPLGLKNGASDLAIAQKFIDKLPIGFLIFVWEKEAGTTEGRVIGKCRPLIVEDPRANELNTKALNRYTVKIRKNLSAAGVVRDERN